MKILSPLTVKFLEDAATLREDLSTWAVSSITNPIHNAHLLDRAHEILSRLDEALASAIIEERQNVLRCAEAYEAFLKAYPVLPVTVQR